MSALRDLSADEIAALSGIVAKMRPTGARRWDAAGVRAAFAKAANLDAANVLMAAIRLSQDTTATTPSNIAKPNTECWIERPGTWVEPAPPYSRATHCGICSRPREDCQSRIHSGHEYRPANVKIPDLGPDDVHEITNELRDILAKAKGAEK